MILRGIFHVVLVSGFTLHFMLYRGNLDCFSNSVHQQIVLLELDGLSLSRHTLTSLLWSEFRRLRAGLAEVNPFWDSQRLDQVGIEAKAAAW